MQRITAADVEAQKQTAMIFLQKQALEEMAHSTHSTAVFSHEIHQFLQAWKEALERTLDDLHRELMETLSRLPQTIATAIALQLRAQPVPVVIRQEPPPTQDA